MRTVIRSGMGLAAMLLAVSAIHGNQGAIEAIAGPITPRRGTQPNSERKSKAEKKRAKRQARNLRLIADEVKP